MIPSGRQELFTNRVAWALTHMAQAGLPTRPQRGRYLLTERGIRVLRSRPDRVDVSVLAQFPEYQQFRNHRSETALADADTRTPDMAPVAG
jgi:restriction system protein